MYLEEILRILLIWASFIKCLNSMTIYRRFGQLVSMIRDMLKGLYTFIISYVFFILFFAIQFAELEVQIDEELNTNDGGEEDPKGYGFQSEYMRYFGMIIVAVYRNSVGKLGFFNYNNHIISEQSSSILMIWINYFISIIFLFTIGLNFMVGVINETYQELEKLESAIFHKNKALLNLECLQILKFIRDLPLPFMKRMPRLDVVVFSKWNKEFRNEELLIHGNQE